MKIKDLFEKEDKDTLADVIKDQEFTRSKSRITSDGKRLEVEVLTKQQRFDDREETVEFTYIINPTTKAWSFRAGLPGGEDVEFATGEDESTLIKHLKRKNKLKASAIDDYLL